MKPRRENNVEFLRQEIQSSLDAKKSLRERNQLGQYATPIALAIEVAEFVQSLTQADVDGLRFADPAVGTGSFFSAALSVFGSERIESAVGVELDSAFSHAARSLWVEAGLKVIEADFTRLVVSGSAPKAPNLILTNPPYVRHHHLDRAEKERLQRVTRMLAGVAVNGLAGLYVYFLLLATAWMAEDGIAAWLIPSEFMDVNYGEALKEFLLERVTLLRVHRFDPDDVQFDDALVSSVVLVLRKTKPPVDHFIEFSFGGTLRAPLAQELVSADCLHGARKWSVFPNHTRNDRCAPEKSHGPSLSDLFRIQRGIATGCNDFFILSRPDAQCRGLPGRYLRPILPSPRFLRELVIAADEDGYPLIDQQLCVIDCDLPERVVKSEYKTLWDYLQTAKSRGIRDRYLIRKRSPWYKQEQRAPAPFLCTYMGRGAKERQPFRFIWNQSNAVGTNLFLMLYPKGSMREMLRRHVERGREVRDILGQVSAYELRGAGRVYGGGLHKIEPKELGRISAAPIFLRWPELREGMDRTETKPLFC